MRTLRLRLTDACLSGLFLLCAGCVWCSVGYKVKAPEKAPVQIAEVEGRFVIGHVKTECPATGYIADYTEKYIFAELTPERLNRYLASEYPGLFSADGKHPIDLTIASETVSVSHDIWVAVGCLSLSLIPVPMDGCNVITFEGHSRGDTKDILFRCNDGVCFELRGWWSFLPTAMIPVPLATDTPKEAIVTDMQFSSGMYGECAQALLIEQVCRSLINAMKRAGFDNIKRKVVLDEVRQR